ESGALTVGRPGGTDGRFRSGPEVVGRLDAPQVNSLDAVVEAEGLRCLLEIEGSQFRGNATRRARAICYGCRLLVRRPELIKTLTVTVIIGLFGQPTTSLDRVAVECLRDRPTQDRRRVGAEVQDQPVTARPECRGVRPGHFDVVHRPCRGPD